MINPSLRSQIAQQRPQDLYNSLQGVGLIGAPVASAIGGVANVGIQGVVNKINKQPKVK